MNTTYKTCQEVKDYFYMNGISFDSIKYNKHNKFFTAATKFSQDIWHKPIYVIAELMQRVLPDTKIVETSVIRTPNLKFTFYKIVFKLSTRDKKLFKEMNNV